MISNTTLNQVSHVSFSLTKKKDVYVDVVYLHLKRNRIGWSRTIKVTYPRSVSPHPTERNMVQHGVSELYLQFVARLQAHLEP